MTNRYIDGAIKEGNKKLCDMYPFLIPVDRAKRAYDYESTWLDFMPNGWLKAFGLDMCQDIKKILLKGNCLGTYKVLQIKEKYGGLRWYGTGASDEIADELDDLITQYEYVSEHVCIRCGKFPVHMCGIGGYILPYCPTCLAKAGHETDAKQEYEDDDLWLGKDENNHHVYVSEDIIEKIEKNQANLGFA